jgi:hypothetical protein
MDFMDGLLMMMRRKNSVNRLDALTMRTATTPLACGLGFWRQCGGWPDQNFNAKQTGRFQEKLAAGKK